MNTVDCLVPYNALQRRPKVGKLDLSTITNTDVDDEGLVARRVVTRIEPVRENAIQFVKDARFDKHPDSFPEWQMIEEYFDRIRALPGSAHAFRYLLQSAEGYRRETMSWWPGLRNGADVPELCLYGMCKFLADKANAELDEYEDRVKDAYRPADTYRAYGIALRYATEELGSFSARKALARLMLASPLPVDELENPDWIDPYTSEPDGDYTYLKVKEPTEVSSDGNIPAMIQDLLDSMGETDAEAFQQLLQARGSSLDEYWMQFKEAQRSGYANLPEPEEEWEEPEFNPIVNERELFGEDLKPSEAADKLKYLLREELAYMKDVVEATAEYSGKNLRQFAADAEERIKSELVEQKKKYVPGIVKARAWEEAWRRVHDFFRADKRTIWFFNRIQWAVARYAIPDVMSLLLPLQNSFGIWEDDLYEIRLPRGRITLAHWFNIFGEEFLEPFVNRENVDYGDPQVNKKYGNRYVSQSEPTLPELEEFVWRTVWTQNDLYQDSEKRREQWNEENRWEELVQKFCESAGIEHIPGKIRVLKYKQDAKWHPAFVFAEVQTAIMGEGGSQSAQAAGWDAWRQAIDPDANAVYKFERRHGKKHAEAMAKFWEVVKANKNRIASVNASGIKLRSGRQVDWGVALLKFKAHEIPMTAPDFDRLLTLLKAKKWGTPKLLALLEEQHALAVVIS